MKEYFLNLANYQRWANDRFRENLRKLEFENFSIETPYGPLLDVVVHIFGAVDLWMKRIDGISPKNIRSSEGYSDWESVERDWLDIDNQLIDFIKSINEEELNKEISYTSIKGLKLKTSLDNILIQLISHHQSYHRGQIGMFLREKGFEPVKESDYIYYVYD
ncbi:MAG: hypothetical protein HeimC3_08320 [Candidatus Heimdallarchaeota archaeon LC_3]|nr:MAG: hypothetical protein HeimC3_08320 [Candidatus Heimdallarchaeota archaeon LC_3]